MPTSDKTLSPAPITTPLLGIDGKVSQPWAMYFQKLGVRVGGNFSDTLTTVIASMQSVKTTISDLQASDAAQATEIAGLTTEASALDGRVTALETNAGGASGAWTPAFAGVAGSPIATGYWKTIGNEVFWECIVDSAGGTAVFTSAQLTNMPFAASRPGTFAVVNVVSYHDYGNGFVSGSAATIPSFSLTNEVAIFSGRYTT